MTRFLRKSNQFRRNFASILPGVGVALVVIGLLKLGLWQPLENLTYSVLFQLRGPIPWDDRVVVIAIDEPSLRSLGRFPWTRDRYAQLLSILTRAESDLVVFNILFSEPSADDPVFAAAMLTHGRVVLAQTWDSQRNPLVPTPPLRDAAIAIGHIAQVSDQDGITRQIRPQVQGISALSVAAIEGYQLIKQAILPLEPVDSLWVNWLGPVSQVPTYSYQAVLSGEVFDQAFRQKIVVVGVTATGFDPLRTPFHHAPPTTGVYLHATAIANLLMHNSLKVPAEGWVLLGLLLTGASLSHLLNRWPTRRYGFAAGLGLVWVLVVYLALCFGYWLPIISPLALLLGTMAAVVLSRYWQETQYLRAEIARLWRAYQVDLVAQQPQGSTELLQTDFTAALSPHVSQLAELAEQLGRSQSAQAAISRSVSVGLVATDLNGRVWFCNRLAMAQLPVRVGDKLVMQLVPAWLEASQWNDWVTAALHTAKGSLPKPIQQGDRWFELKLEPLLTASQDAAQGLLLMIEDISDRMQVEDERRQTEATLKRQMQTLEELNQLKDDFLSTVSHELRTPMSNIKMAIHMMQLTMKLDAPNRYLQILSDECDREINLINDLLDLQRLESHHKTLSLQEITLQTWLPRLIEPFYERTQGRQQQLKTQIDPNLPPLTTDLANLERILAELLNNACKYTPPGEMISLNVKSTVDQIQFEIHNSGSEISESEQDQIFEKFYRVRNSDRWQQGGTGLGLALVKKLVEHLNGTIWVTSHANETAFIVQLPVHYPAQLSPSQLDLSKNPE